MSKSLPGYFTRPDFAVAVRGYDRAQVDDYLRRVRGWLDDAEARRAATEDANGSLDRKVRDLEAMVAALEERVGLPAGESMSAFGERLGSVMQSAIDAAEGLRAEAEREARQRRDASTADAQEIVEGAKSEAGSLLQRARDEEAAIARSIDELRAERHGTLAEIARLHGHLGDLLAVPDPAVPGATVPDPAPTRHAGPVDAPGVDETAVLAVPVEPPLGGAGEGPAMEEQAEAPVADPAPGTTGTDEPQRTSVLVTSAPTVVQAAIGARAPSNRPPS